MMPSTSSNHAPLMSEINVTPFVDIMLVLLIIFMVTAPLIQQSVDVELPVTESTNSTAIQENDVVLKIDQKRQIFLLNKKLRLEDLSEQLKMIYTSKSKKEIYLQADKKIPYGYVVKVMALLKNAAIDRMGMITEPES